MLMYLETEPVFRFRSEFVTLTDFMISATEFPTKDATSTTTVKLLSSLVLAKLVHKNSSLTVFTFAILFLNFNKALYFRLRPKYLQTRLV